MAQIDISKEDIADFCRRNQKFIRVKRSYKRGQYDKTKNGKVRRVDMSDQLAASLKKLLTKRKKEALKEGRGEPIDCIFHRNSKPMEQNHARRVFKRVLAKAGIRERRFHDIRHTFASLLRSRGESPFYVKEQLGHSSIQVTIDIYGHLIPGSNRGAVNQLDAPHPSATYENRKAVTHKDYDLFFICGAEGRSRE